LYPASDIKSIKFTERRREYLIITAVGVGSIYRVLWSNMKTIKPFKMFARKALLCLSLQATFAVANPSAAGQFKSPPATSRAKFRYW
jgi:hypothetical protein